jgi:hypothetical protein
MDISFSVIFRKCFTPRHENLNAICGAKTNPKTLYNMPSTGNFCIKKRQVKKLASGGSPKRANEEILRRLYPCDGKKRKGSISMGVKRCSTKEYPSENTGGISAVHIFIVHGVLMPVPPVE